MKNRISLATLDALFASLQHRAFRGSCDLALGVNSCQKKWVIFLTECGAII